MFLIPTTTADAELARRFDVCFAPDSEEFVHSSVADANKSIKLAVILDTTKLLPLLANFNDADRNTIALLTERFKDYEFPVVTIKDRTNQEVCRVFQRINSSGTSLSTLELLAAWTWSDAFDLRNEFETLSGRLADKGYGDLDEALLMRCLAAIVLDVIDADALVDTAPERLIEGMSTLKQSAYAAIDFLDKELEIKNVVFVPFPIMLVPLIRFFSKTLKPNANQRSGLRKWFWFCSFTERYKAGTNKAVLEDLRNMLRLADGDPVFDDLPKAVDSSLFKKTWRINSTAAKAAICLLAQHKPRSFLNGAPVDLGTALAAYNAREFHHIYPKGFLSTLGIPFHESNVIANVCLLTASDNRNISDKSPQVYFPEIPDEVRKESFDAALIPSGTSDGSKLYTEFLNLRAELLAVVACKLISDGKL